MSKGEVNSMNVFGRMIKDTIVLSETDPSLLALEMEKNYSKALLMGSPAGVLVVELSRLNLSPKDLMELYKLIGKRECPYPEPQFRSDISEFDKDLLDAYSNQFPQNVRVDGEEVTLRVMGHYKTWSSDSYYRMRQVALWSIHGVMIRQLSDHLSVEDKGLLLHILSDHNSLITLKNHISSEMRSAANK